MSELPITEQPRISDNDEGTAEKNENKDAIIKLNNRRKEEQSCGEYADCCVWYTPDDTDVFCCYLLCRNICNMFYNIGVCFVSCGESCCSCLHDCLCCSCNGGDCCDCGDSGDCCSCGDGVDCGDCDCGGCDCDCLG